MSLTPRFPLFVSLAGKPVLIVGGGAIASRRAHVLLRFGARLTVVAPELSDLFEDILAQITWKQDIYSGIDGTYTIVLAATDDRAVNRQVGLDAKSRNIPVSVADSGAESSFWFPAIAECEGIVAGLISETGDHSAVKQAAALVRQALKEEMG